MEENKNHGVLITSPKPTDYKFAGTSKIDIARVVGDWSPFLPEPENQASSTTDFLVCVTMSAQHAIETQLNYLYKNNLFSDEALNFFTQYKYIKNGKFNLSARFNAKLNSTDKLKGNFLNAVGEKFRVDGCIPEYLWPMTPNMTWNDFYTEVPQSLIDLGKKFLWFINSQYQWVDRSEIPFSLKSSPVQIATAVCSGWDSGKVVEKCDNKPVQHATMLYGINPITYNYLDLDQYAPYKQELAHDYNLPYNMQYIASMKSIVLRKGMQGINVLTMQENLQKLGYKLENDSFFGPGTEGIVKAFQSKNGLVADGIAGTQTLAKLKDLLSNPSSLLPVIKRKSDELIQKCKEKGFNIRITSGFRTKEDQEKLYQQGRTTPGPIITNVQYPKSLHCHGMAFDVCFLGDEPYPSDNNKWKAIADIGLSLGLTAGFYFPTFQDRPHFEFKGTYTYQNVYDFKYNKSDFE